MDFILTKFIYPLKDKLEIYDGYYFDNPRTPQEVKCIEKFIRKASPFPKNDQEVGEEGFITIDYAISKMKQKYSDDSYVCQYIDNCKYKDAFYKVASMWVILRLKEKSQTIDDYFSQTEKVHHKIDALTLLTYPESHCYDFSALISGEFSSLYEEEIIDKTQNSIIEAMVEFIGRKKGEKGDYRFCGFMNYYHDIYTTNQRILKCQNQEVLNYIMESLQTLRKNHDLKMKFVSIVSVIELLLTHCPDFNRYHVEDSISKQFRNKIALVCYLNNKDIDYELLSKEASLIYSLRSNVAHGNFEEFPKVLEKYFNFCKEHNYTRINIYDKINTLGLLINRTMQYMVLILNTYIDDYKLCDIVKKI